VSIIGDATIAVDSDTSKFAKDVEDKTSAVAKKAAALFATGFSARAVVDFARDSIGAASDLNETVSKTQQVFGAASGSVLKFGDTSAQALGASKQDALASAATFGNLLRSVGLTEQQAASFSTSMVKLGGDLASFNNVPVPEALDAIRAGLVGETEPLKRFGVNLNDATLKQKALQLGLSDGKGVLDANAKAQAAYALIMEQTTLAQGDFARTSSGLANQQRILAAEFDNVKASIGQQLLPVAIELVGTVRDAVPEFQQLASTALPALVSSARAFVPVGMSFLQILTGLAPLLEVAADVITSIPAPLLTMATTAALLGSGMGPLPNLFKDFAGGMRSVTAEGGGTASAMDKVKGGVASLNPYIIAGTVALYALSKGMQEHAESERIAKQAVDDATAAFRDHAQAIGDDAKALARSRIEQAGLQEDLNDLGITYDQLGGFLSSGQEGLDSLSRVMKSHGGVSKDLLLTIKSLSDSYQQAAKDQLNSLVASEDLTRQQVREAESRNKLDDGTSDYVGTLRSLEGNLKKAEDGTAGLTAAVGVQTDSLEVQEKQLKDTTDALDKFLGRQIAGQDLVIAYEKSLDDLTEGLKDNGRTLDVNTEKGRDNISNLREVRDAIIKATEARYAETKNADDAAGTADMLIGRLKDELRQRGLSQKAIYDYIAALNLTPKDIRTNLIVNADEAAGKLAGFATLVKVIGQKSADAFVQGFVVGLRDGEGQLVTSADSAAHRIETAVRGRLQQKSPSRVGIDIGRNFSESIGAGIDEGSATAEDAIRRVGAYLEQSIYAASQVTRAEEAAILRAHQAIIASQQRLNDVRKDATHTAEQLRLAEIEVGLAQEEYNQAVEASVSTTGALADAEQHLADVASRVRDQVASVFGALSAGFASGDARAALTDAQRDLAKLRREQEQLPAQIAAAEKKLADARTDAARTTAAEALAIVRAQKQVADAQARVAAASEPPGVTTAEALAIVQAKQQVASAEKRLADEQAKATPDALAMEEATLLLTTAQTELAKVQAAAVAPAGDLREAQLDLAVAQQQLADAQADAVAPTRAVADAERALADLRAAAATIADRVRDATQAVTEAEIAQIEATQRLRDAQAELVGQGPAAIQHFRDMAAAAGLTRAEIDALVDSLTRLNDSGGAASNMPGGQNQRPGPVGGAIPPSGAGSGAAHRLRQQIENIGSFVGEDWSAGKVDRLMEQVRKGQTDLDKIVQDVDRRINGPQVVMAAGAVQVGVMDTSLVMTKLNVTAAVGKAVKSAARLTPAGR
jgi:hypothetical protein